MLISILQLKHFSNNYQSYSILPGSGRIVKTFLKEPQPQSQGKKLSLTVLDFLLKNAYFLLIKTQFLRKIRDRAL